MALIVFKIIPSGRSCKNSNAAVSFSIIDILTYRSSSVIRQSSMKSNLLSAAKKDLVSCSMRVDELEFRCVEDKCVEIVKVC